MVRQNKESCMSIFCLHSFGTKSVAESEEGAEEAGAYTNIQAINQGKQVLESVKDISKLPSIHHSISCSS